MVAFRAALTGWIANAPLECIGVVILIGGVLFFGLLFSVPVLAAFFSWKLVKQGNRPGGAFIVVALLFFTIMEASTKFDVRPATGEMRNSVWGVGYTYWSQPEVVRMTLASFSDLEEGDTWVRWSRYGGTNYLPSHLSSLYFDIAAWNTVNPAVAKVMYQELMSYIEDGPKNLPDIFYLGLYASPRNGSPYVKSGWESDHYVRRLLEKHGITFH